MSNLVHFKCDNSVINRAFRIAIGDVATNICSCDLGLIKQESDAVMAGLDYDFPWTRDAAINTWNGLSLIDQEVAHNTLMAMVEKVEGQLRINHHQYWDAIAWAVGAWQHYLYTGDREFLSTAIEAIANSLEYFEQTEWDDQLALFRGAAHTADGTSGYPEAYLIDDGNGSTCIGDWPEANPDLVHPVGYGIPMHALSTNCLYYQGYRVAQLMAKELKRDPDPKWDIMADRLRDGINKHFWIGDKGFYRHMVDPLGNCDHQDCIGLGYALLFDIADADRAKSVLDSIHTVPAGIPVGWPDYPRYEKTPGDSYGRHSTCVWPPFEAMFASAAAKYKRSDLLMHVVNTLAEYACRDMHFAEVFHPMTGEIYGGVQEFEGDKEFVWQSCSRQTWSATAFIRLLLLDVVGMNFTSEFVKFKPLISGGILPISLKNIKYRQMELDITIEGVGSEIAEFHIDGTLQEAPILAGNLQGTKKVKIVMTGKS